LPSFYREFGLSKARYAGEPMDDEELWTRAKKKARVELERDLGTISHGLIEYSERMDPFYGKLGRWSTELRDD
jgi:hypothetical protein